jgi:hypothetical protein
MIETAIYVFLGAFVGWNLPQPQFAKDLQAKAIAFFKGSTAK